MVDLGAVEAHLTALALHLGSLGAHLGAMAVCPGALAAHLRAPAAYLGVLAVHLGALATHLGAIAAYVGALAAPLSSMRAFRTCAPRGNGGGEGIFEDLSGLPEGPAPSCRPTVWTDPATWGWRLGRSLTAQPSVSPLTARRWSSNTSKTNVFWEKHVFSLSSVFARGSAPICVGRILGCVGCSGRRARRGRHTRWGRHGAAYA